MDVNDALRQIEEIESQAANPPAPAAEGPKPPRMSLAERAVRGLLTPDDVPEEAYRSFSRSVLGGVPFTHSFQVLKGQVTLVFGEPTGELARQYHLVRDRIDPEQMETLSRLAILGHLVSIDGPDGPLYRRTDDLGNATDKGSAEAAQAIDVAYMAMVTKVGGSLARVIPQLWVLFGGLWTVLVNNEVPSSF